MPEYTVLSALAVAVVIGAEVLWLRTGLFRSRAYWISMAIIIFFMVLTNGWLTKLSAPIVTYNRDFNSGLRFPLDIPVEDFGFGFSLVTLTMLLWDRAGRARDRA